MSGCRKPDFRRPEKGTPNTTIRFKRDMRFEIRVHEADWRKDVRRNVAAWVATKVAPHPTSLQSIILSNEVYSLSIRGFPIADRRTGTRAIAIVSAKTLNNLAKELVRALKSGHLVYRVQRVTVIGGNEREGRFVVDHLPLVPGGILDSRDLSDSLYKISRVPGFARVDAIVVPVSRLRNGAFKNPVTFLIRTKNDDWRREIRRDVTLYVAKQSMDTTKSAFKRALEEVVDWPDSRFWKPLGVEIVGDGTYRVSVPVRLLNAIKRALMKVSEQKEPVPPFMIDTNEESTGKGVTEFTRPSTGGISEPSQSPPNLENLFVKVTPESTFEGSQIETDNYGYAPTGAVLLNATGNANNAGVPGGLFAIDASTSFGGMSSGTLSYSFPLGLTERLGADVFAMDYTLGNGFSPWGHGVSTVQLQALGVGGSNYGGDFWMRKSFVENPDAMLALKGTVWVKEFQDNYSQTVQNDRSLIGGTLDLSGFWIAGPAILRYDIADTEYSLVQGSGSSPLNPFYSDTQGLMNYLTGLGQIQVALTRHYSVSLESVDQQAIGAGVLDPMLQATIGGVANVMALPTASLFGNNLYAGMLTFTRTDPAGPGFIESSVFFDAAQITGIGIYLDAMGPGVEESWTQNHIFAKVDAAIPVGGLPVSTLGNSITAVTGSNISQGGLPLQVWLMLGLKY